jgi:hypothetical protein
MDPTRADNYAHLKELGRGTFGAVDLVKRRSDGRMFVIKSLFISTATMTEDEIFEAENEVRVLRRGLADIACHVILRTAP